MNLKHILPVVNFSFASLPVDQLNGILQGVSTEDAEHWTEDLILISLHTWTSGRHYWLRQGAQGVTLSVCPCVCLSGTNLSKALNLHLSLIDLSQVSLGSVSAQFQVSLRSLCAYFFRQTEPKILRLVTRQ